MNLPTMFLVSCSVLLLIHAGIGSCDKVLLGYYGEALCPDCVAFSNGPLTDAFNQVSKLNCVIRIR